MTGFRVTIAPCAAHRVASGVSLSVFASYVILYGGYSKVSKSYEVCSRLKTLFSCRVWLNNSLAQSKELNKIVALTAMSMVSLAATGAAYATTLPSANDNSLGNVAWALSQQAVVAALGHIAFSDLYIVFRDPKKYILGGEKTLSVVLGSLGFVSFAFLSNELQPEGQKCAHMVRAVAMLANILVTGHVYLMERKVVAPAKTKSLDMRPYGVFGLYAHMALTVASVGLFAAPLLLKK